MITGVFVNRSSRKLIKQLAQQVEAQPLTLVVGASGTGKSSLVKAGVLPYVRHMLDGQSESNNADEVTRKLQHGNRWHILPVVRPTEAPLQIFIEVIELLQEGLTTAIRLPLQSNINSLLNRLSEASKGFSSIFGIFQTTNIVGAKRFVVN